MELTFHGCWGCRRHTVRGEPNTRQQGAVSPCPGQTGPSDGLVCRGWGTPPGRGVSAEGMNPASLPGSHPPAPHAPREAARVSESRPTGELPGLAGGDTGVAVTSRSGVPESAGQAGAAHPSQRSPPPGRLVTGVLTAEGTLGHSPEGGGLPPGVWGRVFQGEGTACAKHRCSGTESRWVREAGPWGTCSQRPLGPLGATDGGEGGL